MLPHGADFTQRRRGVTGDWEEEVVAGRPGMRLGGGARNPEGNGGHDVVGRKLGGAMIVVQCNMKIRGMRQLHITGRAIIHIRPGGKFEEGGKACQKP